MKENWFLIGFMSCLILMIFLALSLGKEPKKEQEIKYIIIKESQIVGER